jgi:DNA-binding NarL/FixJ family response regulator
LALRILLADDHPIVREGLRVLLERRGMQVAAMAGDGREAARLAETLQPDVVVLDFFMPLLNGLDSGRQILRRQPKAAVLLLSMAYDPHQIVAAHDAGIRGYVVKTQAADELIAAIQTVASGETYVSEMVAQLMLTAQLAGSDIAVEPLTRRERELLQLVVEGRETNEIAALLGVSVKTAESYRADLMLKLNADDTAGLVRYARRLALIQAIVASKPSSRAESPFEPR